MNTPVLICISAIISTITILFLIIVYFKSKTGKCTSKVCLAGKTAIITGGNSGLGYQLALDLATRGCHVIIADVEDAQKTKHEISDQTNNPNIITKFLDLNSLTSVRKFAEDIKENESRLDILVNNAGVGVVTEALSEDGLSKLMQINYFGHFLLTHLLIDLLKKSAPSRIIFLSSILSFYQNLTLGNLNCQNSDECPNNFRLYGNSKLCAIIAANGFAERLEGTQVVCNSVDPGFVSTNIHKKTLQYFNVKDFFIRLYFDTVLKLMAKTPRKGAQTSIHVCVSNELSNVSGKHFADCQISSPPSKTQDKDFCEKIWRESEKLVKLQPHEIISTNKLDEIKIINS